jgi:hypothetical protein
VWVVVNFAVQVYEFVQLAELYYAGSHGMDIMGPADATNGFKAKGTRVKDKMVLKIFLSGFFCSS